MNTLAIDPGPTDSAYVVWNGVAILDKGIVPSTAILAVINTMGTLSAMEPEKQFAVVCERVACYGMPVGKEVFETCFYSGRYWERADAEHLKFFLVPRLEVKMHLCGQARAKDGNISQALKDRFGDKGTKAAPGLTYGLSADMWQAFALAVTFNDSPALLKYQMH